ncbi:MAG: magnesium chelatase [Gemmatales bacterium]|nr:MAG: magnesium chelatase [Gemmatales bacterium]
MFKRCQFPFAALVGQEPLCTALLAVAVNPSIGGVLIRGEKGTAKSTAARALAELLPTIATVAGCPFHCDPADRWAECFHCTGQGEKAVVEIPAPFVTLPLGATEERVIGALDFEQALREGRKGLQPGLLASAHRGILYIDEVNLLADHLVDLLLDAAATGVNIVEREGITFSHPSRFILIGTMNPEEGEVRPQLLDRFGLVVESASPRDAVLRAEIVRRRIAFETDPVGFVHFWQGEQDKLRTKVREARVRLPEVVVSDELLRLVARICVDAGVDGLRADIVMHKTAQTLAALAGRKSADIEDVRQAAEFVLPHRRKHRQPSSSGSLPRHSNSPPISKNDSGVSNDPADESKPLGRSVGVGEQVFAARDPGQPIQLPDSSSCESDQNRRVGKLSGKQSEHGRHVRSIPDRKPTELAMDATLRAAAARTATATDSTFAVEQRDLHGKVRRAKNRSLTLFAVDSSGSMGARRRMEAVKGAVLQLLRDSTQRHARVSVIAFRGAEAKILLPPTDSFIEAEQALHALPTGGRTPLAHGLFLAREIIGSERRQRVSCQFILLTDGKANVPLPGSDGDPWQQAFECAREIARLKIPTLVLDTDCSFVRIGKARRLAEALQARYETIADPDTDQLIQHLQTDGT